VAAVNHTLETPEPLHCRTRCFCCKPLLSLADAWLRDVQKTKEVKEQLREELQRRRDLVTAALAFAHCTHVPARPEDSPLQVDGCSKAASAVRPLSEQLGLVCISLTFCLLQLVRFSVVSFPLLASDVPLGSGAQLDGYACAWTLFSDQISLNCLL
jgi:hypothetical protein